MRQRTPVFCFVCEVSRRYAVSKPFITIASPLPRQKPEKRVDERTTGEQVILNLLLNAQDAMADAGKVHVSIDVESAGSPFLPAFNS